MALRSLINQSPLDYFLNYLTEFRIHFLYWFGVNRKEANMVHSNYIQQACELGRVMRSQVVTGGGWLPIYQNNLFDFDLGKRPWIVLIY